MSALTAPRCSTLLFAVVVVFVSADPKIIIAKSGQDVTLKCRAPNNKTRAVEWKRTDLLPEYVLWYQDGQFAPANQHPSFKNRVDLQDRQMKDGNMSLILKNVTTTDNGTYEGQVYSRGENQNNAPEMLICSIYLTVVDPPGQTGGHTEDGGKEDGGKEDGSVGLKVGLSVPAVLLFVAVVAVLIYRKHKKVKNVNYVSTCSSQS